MTPAPSASVPSESVILKLPGAGQERKALEGVISELREFAKSAGSPFDHTASTGFEGRDMILYLRSLVRAAAPAPPGWIEVDNPGGDIWSQITKRAERLVEQEACLDTFSLLALAGAMVDWTDDRMTAMVEHKPVPGISAEEVAREVGLARTLEALKAWLASGGSVDPLGAGPYAKTLSHVVLENTSFAAGDSCPVLLDFISEMSTFGAMALAQNPRFTEISYQALIAGVAANTGTDKWPMKHLFRFGFAELFRLAHKRGWSLRPETVSDLRRQMPSLAIVELGSERLVVPELARDEGCYQILASSPRLQAVEHYAAAMFFHDGRKWMALAKRGLEAARVAGWDGIKLDLYLEALAEGVARLSPGDLAREDAIPFIAAGHPRIRDVGRNLAVAATRGRRGR